MKAEQREGYEYELTVSLDMLHENKFAIPQKTGPNFLIQQAK